MRAIILAAGIGKRMSEVSEGMPKCLIPFKGKTILERQLELFKQANIKDIVIVTGFKKELIQKASPKAKHIFNKDFETSNNITSVLKAEKEILNNDCIITYADILFDKDTLIECKKSRNSCLVVSKQGDSEQVRAFNKRVVEIGNHLDKLGNSRFIGLAKIRAKDTGLFLHTIKLLLPEYKDRYYTKAIRKMIMYDVIFSAIKSGKWAELDTPENQKEIGDLLSAE